MWQKLKNYYHLIVAILANLYFKIPSKQIKIIGVTGTDGKTTTVSLIYHILNYCGYNTSMISSVEAIIEGKSYDTGFHVTTPSSWTIQKYLKKIADIKTESHKFLVLEVTSHAIDQYRIWGIGFDIGVLTNITDEHLDYHKSYEKYVFTKAKLLQSAKKAIVNRDDDSYEILNFKLKNKKILTYGFHENSNLNLTNFKFQTNLLGDFNKYNILAAASVAKTIGISQEKIAKAIISFNLPKGRVDVVHEGIFKIIIDFAHTPNALEQILCSLRKEIKGRIIHVFGSAGQRDKQKRPKMGKISEKYANIIIITAEDPRLESVEKIIEEISSGISSVETKIKNGILFKIPDRQEAINKAVSLAKKNDIIIITGKGHEQSMNFGNGEVLWSDFDAAQKALKIKYV